MNQLDALKQFSTVVVDTGDFGDIGSYQPRDATTNPSLVLQAVQMPNHAALRDAVLQKFRGRPVDELMDRLLVCWGCEILKRIPGRVSTEVDARLSFDEDATVARAQRLVELYEAQGVHIDRVLIKVAATWEGIQAARQLESRGIHTNLTLLFSFCQAVVCAQAKVQLISPFVGRVYDWHKAAAGVAWIPADHAGANDPGVQFVTRIYNYYKKFDVKTEVMAASFRNVEQITALVGCDLLTISPQWLSALAGRQVPLLPVLRPELAQACALEHVHLDEAQFRMSLNDDAMATEKLAEGIRVFCADTVKLEKILLSA